MTVYTLEIEGVLLCFQPTKLRKFLRQGARLDQFTSDTEFIQRHVCKTLHKHVFKLQGYFILEQSETLYEPPHLKAVARPNISTALSASRLHLPSSFHVMYFSLVLKQQRIQCTEQIVTACRKQWHHAYLYNYSMNSEVSKGDYLICNGIWLIAAIIRTFWGGNLLFTNLSHFM